MNNIEKKKEEFYEEFPELLFCTRVWSAWGYGTMTADDFENATEEVWQWIEDNLLNETK